LPDEVTARKGGAVNFVVNGGGRGIVVGDGDYEQ
jgi:hypothetical protein